MQYLLILQILLINIDSLKFCPIIFANFQAIANFEERNETLTLRGERLDAKHCETLEEILRRVQFRTIDLEATHLDDEV